LVNSKEIGSRHTQSLIFGEGHIFVFVTFRTDKFVYWLFHSWRLQ